MPRLSQLTAMSRQMRDFELHDGDELRQLMPVPFYMYLRNINDGEYTFLEITDDFLKTYFDDSDIVTRGNVVRMLSEKGYRIIVEAKVRRAVINNIKVRYEKLLKNQKELNCIKTIFENNPEYLI